MNINAPSFKPSPQAPPLDQTQAGMKVVNGLKIKTWIKDLPIKDELLQKEIAFLDRKYSSLTKIITPNFIIISFNLPIDEPDFPFDIEYLSLILKITFHQSIKCINLKESSLPPKIEKRINDFFLKNSSTPLKDLLRITLRSLESLLTPLPELVESKGIRIVNNLSLQIEKSLLINSVKDDLLSHNNSNISFQNITRQPPALPPPPALPSATPVTIYKTPIFLEAPPPPPLNPQAIIEGENVFSAENIISLVYPISLAITLVCHRCQTQNHIPSLQRNQITITSCIRCKQYFESNFIPSILTKHKNCLGYLLLKRCSPFFLKGIEAQLQCYDCCNEILISPLIIDERIPYYCRNCSLNTSFLIRNIKFITALKVKEKKEEKRIAIGEALPLQGSCKHFKKSFRWFRFPCCNKAFPCEICHNEAIKIDENPPHIVEERAKRHICGWCSREMPVEITNCVCGNEPGSSKAKTSHWEGGKGLRDRTKMSRKDRKKWSNKN